MPRHQRMVRLWMLLRQSKRAPDGKHRLEIGSRHRPDPILFDLKRPLMQRSQFLEQLRRTPSSPAAIVTGYPDSERMKQAMKHGPLPPFAKSVAPAQHQATVATVLGDRLGRRAA